MKLTTLKSRLQRAPARLGTLTARPNVLTRKTGWAGKRDRERIRERDGELCQNCGQLGRDVDHDVPLWVGVAAGGTDEDSNKRVLCTVCHEAKSKLETSQRAAGTYDYDTVRTMMGQLGRSRRLV